MLLKIGQVAEELGLAAKTVRKWITAEKIQRRAVRPGVES
jgi:DNA-binding transcriptional MerR regulator